MPRARKGAARRQSKVRWFKKAAGNRMGRRSQWRRVKGAVIRAGVYINRYTVIDAFEKVEIGEGALIGPHCYIADHDHARVPGMAGINTPLRGAAIAIGRRVYLGAGVVVTKGVTIGDDATVGAGAVVRQDVAPGAVVAGVPARPVTQPLRATA